MLIPLKTQDYKILIKSYIASLNPILKLTDKEQNALCAILYTYYSRATQKTPDINVDKQVFSTPSRKLLFTSLNLSENSFNNIIVSLKKKKVLDVSKVHGILISPVIVHNILSLKEKGYISLTYEFTLLKDNQSTQSKENEKTDSKDIHLQVQNS